MIVVVMMTIRNISLRGSHERPSVVETLVH